MPFGNQNSEKLDQLGDNNQKERVKSLEKAETMKPMADIFFDDDALVKDPYLKEILSNPEVKEEITMRKELLSKFEAIYAKISDATMDIQEALEKELIEPEEIKEFYLKLADFLELDSNNARIILYLPFEMLPYKNPESKDSGSLASAEMKFTGVYMESWKRLLEEKSLRTNFVNGDILESETGRGMPRVVKAAHLLPELVEERIISPSEIITMLEGDLDPTLKESIFDAMPILADKKLISPDEWQRLLFSKDKDLVNVAFKTAHTFEPGVILEIRVINRIFDLFDSGNYQADKAHEMYLTFGERFYGLQALVEGKNLSAADIEKIKQMMVAGVHFWTMNGDLVKIIPQLSKDNPEIGLSEIVDSYDNFKHYSESTSVEDWIRSWNKKFLTEVGETGDDLVSGEIMTSEKAWERLSQASEKESPAIGLEGNEPLKHLFEKLREDLKQIDEQYQPSPKVFSDARMAWKKKEETNKLFEQCVQIITHGVKSEKIEYSEIKEIISRNNNVERLAGVMAIGKAVEELASTNKSRAQEAAKDFEEVFHQAWQDGPLGVKNALISLLSRWQVMDIVDEQFLEQFDFTLPKLDATNELPEKDAEKIKEIVKTIESDPELSKVFYPVILAFGSQVKGYAELGADSDLALFIKPDASWEEGMDLLKKLTQVFPNQKDIGKAVEFWLAEAGDKLAVRDVPVTEKTIAKKDWAHVLMQSVWYGLPEQMKELRQKLLPSYLETKNKPQGEEERRIWLREMELEVLQYRLMHKGYDRFYPRQGGIETKNSHLIDSQSAFWDPGYRRLATKLFLKKIFLPSVPSRS